MTFSSWQKQQFGLRWFENPLPEISKHVIWFHSCCCLDCSSTSQSPPDKHSFMSPSSLSDHTLAVCNSLWSFQIWTDFKCKLSVYLPNIECENVLFSCRLQVKVLHRLTDVHAHSTWSWAHPVVLRPVYATANAAVCACSCIFVGVFGVWLPFLFNMLHVCARLRENSQQWRKLVWFWGAAVCNELHHPVHGVLHWVNWAGKVLWVFVYRCLHALGNVKKSRRK